MALLGRTNGDRTLTASLLLLSALASTMGCETGYLIDGLPVCDPFDLPEQPAVTAAPAALALAGSGPNPFTNATELRFKLLRPGKLRVEVFDVSGRRVEVLANGDVPAGEVELPWNVASGAEHLPAGVYFVCATYGRKVVTQKLTVIR